MPASSVARLARTVAADTAQAAQFESLALLPLEQLGLRASMFEQRIADLRAATVEAGDLLDRGIERALEQSVNESKTNVEEQGQSPAVRGRGRGTSSDGKLTCGKRHDRIKVVLETFHRFGAPDSILVDAKPHIGTDGSSSSCAT